LTCDVVAYVVDEYCICLDKITPIQGTMKQFMAVDTTNCIESSMYIKQAAHDDIDKQMNINTNKKVS
jgi:hypothetical protein